MQGQLGANTARITTVIQELPTRIISIERLQILRLTLQNIALHVQRRERELQMQTVCVAASEAATRPYACSSHPVFSL